MQLQTLGQGLARSCDLFRSDPALVVDGVTFTYSELGDRSRALGIAILDVSGTRSERVAILASRSAAAYVGIVGAALAGCTYVPLNPRFPTSRLVSMLRAADCRIIVAGEECVESLIGICRSVDKLTIICPFGAGNLKTAAEHFVHHSFVFVSQQQANGSNLLLGGSPDDYAYLMFTSGTTGAPKGVPISQKNVCAYLDYTIRRYSVGKGDRLTQMFDITFDLSVHDIFVSFLSGAALYVVPPESVMAPTQFVRRNELTMWFSVPSVPMFMSRMRMLKPGIFPTLRFALFCGEALPQRTAEAFQSASPNAIVENLYGPTEATIAITNYRWDKDNSPGECVKGVVPIGRAFDGNFTRVVGSSKDGGEQDQPGELYLSGVQVASGYLNDPVRTKERFVRLEQGSAAIWYRTGDLVRLANGNLVYLGRVDDQVQIRGFRVELQEIDQAIRKFAGTDLALAVPTEFRDGCAQGVVAVVQGTSDESVRQTIFSGLRNTLPDYMVPSAVMFIDSMPLNPNGKIDRKAVMELFNGN